MIDASVRRAVREELRAALDSNATGDVLTYAAAAAEMKVDKSTIGRWVRDGLLPAHGRGKAKRVYRADVRKALEASGGGKSEAKTATEIADGILSKPKLRRVR